MYVTKYEITTLENLIRSFYGREGGQDKVMKSSSVAQDNGSHTVTGG